MPKANDYTGQKIGKLLVLHRAESLIVPGGTIVMWKCQCECGLILYRRSSHLKRGRCKCAQCKAQEEHRKYGFEDIRTHHWYSIKKNAERRKIKFDVTIEYGWKLFKEQNELCALSGIKLHFAKTKKSHSTGGTTASLDRIDSTKPYVEGNVQWVHKWINVMKSDHTVEEFIDYCEKVADFNRAKRGI